MNVSPISSSAGAPATFNAASLRNAAPEAQPSAVARQVEAVLIRQLLGKTMGSMLGGKEGGVARSVYGDMLTDTMATQLSSGPGVGLGRFIDRQLTLRGESAPTPPATISPVQPQVRS